MPIRVPGARWVWLTVAAVLAVAIVTPFDYEISAWISRQPHWVVGVFTWITRWGESDWLLYPSFGLLIVSAVLARMMPQRTPKLALLEMVQVYAVIFLGVGLPGLVANLLKRIIGRARPELFDQVGALSFHPFATDAAGLGFPSGHSATAFAAAMVLGYLAPRWFWLGLLYAVAIALSRLILADHYPSDVIAGAAIGVGGGYLVLALFAQRRWLFDRRADGRIERRPLVATRRLVRTSSATAGRTRKADAKAS